MRKKMIVLVILAALLICGCSSPEVTETVPETTAEPTTVVTMPPLKSYTGEVNDEVLAKIGEIQLTNRELQAWYWAEVAQYRQENHEVAPDFDIPLDCQTCGIDENAETWQEYFLWEAVNTWHTAQALLIQSREVPIPTEPAYRPSEHYHQQYMEGMPAAKFLYGHNPYYQLNTMHEAYLQELPERLAALAEEKGYADVSRMAQDAFGTGEEALLAYADVYNQGYMYFTAMSYQIQPAQQAEGEEEPLSGESVDIRHILLIPEATEEEQVSIGADGTVTCPEAAWIACEAAARDLLSKCDQKLRQPEYVFAELAVKHSQDAGTALDGGAYHGIRQGQLMAALDEWCFQAERKAGDTTVIRSEYGVHILYFTGSRTLEQETAERLDKEQQLLAIVEEARQAHPMEADYTVAVLTEAEGTVAAGEILYPDIAHERYPEVPLYLQQDYPVAAYGIGTLAGNGCGITSMAMLATYLADEELTPPELASRFGRYSDAGGTNSQLFQNESSSMGFYLDKLTYDWEEAKEALHQGRIVISLQHAGYWTRYGHFIVIESIHEDDMVQVRDSNIFNYAKRPAHKEDRHTWGSIVTNGQAYWIYEPKITNIPACMRCGSDPMAADILLTQDYLCHKCQPALLRRGIYLGS